MALDQPYLDAIKGFEGFAPQASWDYKQHSNGYGTKAEYPGEKIDKDTAEQRFQGAIAQAAAHVDAIAPNAPPGARAALVSLTYNAGPGWTTSGLGELVKAGDWQGAAERFQQYNKAGGRVNPGLVKRRGQEAAWFNGPPSNVAPQVASAPMTPAASPQGQMPPFMPQQTAAPLPAGAFTPFAPQQQSQGGSPSLFGQMPAEQQAPPPIFAGQRKPIDLSKLRAALQASGNRGLIFSKDS